MTYFMEAPCTTFFEIDLDINFTLVQIEFGISRCIFRNVVLGVSM